MSAMVIAGDKFSGKPGDWADVKTEIVSAIETADYSYITKMGAHLFSVAGSGDHGHVEDGDRIWADILALFEGKDRSGSSSFWSMMCAAVKSVNPKIKGHPGDFAVARNDLQQAWHGLLKMYQDENKPLEALIDRLQADQHLEMMWLMAAHPQEGTAWEDAYKKCVARQGVWGGGLTLDTASTSLKNSPQRP
jgi:hypothetical protein